jgi:hypothetical protein
MSRRNFEVKAGKFLDGSRDLRRLDQKLICGTMIFAIEQWKLYGLEFKSQFPCRGHNHIDSILRNPKFMRKLRYATKKFYTMNETL